MSGFNKVSTTDGDERRQDLHYLVQYLPGLDVGLSRYGIPPELRHIIAGYCQLPMDSKETIQAVIKQWYDGYLNNDCLSYTYPDRQEALLAYGHISGWDTSRITDMKYLFDIRSCSKISHFNENINAWDVSNVTDMSHMFEGVKSFNQSLNRWNVGKVTTMEGMFHNTRAFNQPIGKWTVGQVTNMSKMFYNSNFNQPLNDWDVSQVTDISYMFADTDTCGSHHPFNQPLNAWKVSRVRSMAHMFECSRFNQPINAWDMSSVESVASMFAYNNAFNQPLDQWDVRNIRSFRYMFWSGRAFNQWTLHHWQVASPDMLEKDGMKDMFYWASYLPYEYYLRLKQLWPALT
jgi:surface protein